MNKFTALFRSKAAIFRLTAMCCLWGLFFLVLMLVYPLNRQQIEIDLTSSKGSLLRIYWAAGDERFSERHTAFVKTDKGRATHTLYIDSHAFFTRIRIDPTAKQRSSVILHGLSLRQPGHTPLILTGENLYDLKPIKDIENLTLDDTGLRLKTSGADPQLLLNHAPHPATGISRYTLKLTRLARNAVLATALTLIIVVLLTLWKNAAIIAEKKYRELHYYQSILKDSGINSQIAVRRFEYLMYILFFATLIMLGYTVFTHFHQANTFGTRYSPYSDALLWFRGTLHFLDGLDFKTYRPTINLFFGSIYASFEETVHIPLFGLFLFFSTMLLYFFSSTSHYRVLATLTIVFLLLFYEQTIAYLNIGQLMVDFLPFTLTLTAIFLIGTGLKENSSPASALVLGGLLLIGVAAAVRGVQLIGGAIVLSLVITVFLTRSQPLFALGACFLYFLPLGLDTLLQKIYSAENNGVFSLFCFYHETSHTYTKNGKYMLRALHIPDSEVVLTYLRYFFSHLGFPIFLDYLQDIIKNGSRLVMNAKFYFLLGTGTLLVFLGNRLHLQHWHPTPRQLLRILAQLVVIPLIFWLTPTWGPTILFAYSTLLIVISFFSRQYVTSAMLSVFVGSTILFSMMGMPGTERVAAGFMFCLPLGLLFFITEPDCYFADRKSLYPGRSGFLFGYIFSVLLFLYIGSITLPQPAAARLKQDTIIKISDDPAINRSLYYAADSRIFYTHATPEPVGTIRPFTHLTCPKGTFNGSYIKPCKVE